MGEIKNAQTKGEHAQNEEERIISLQYAKAGLRVKERQQVAMSLFVEKLMSILSTQKPM